MLSREISTASDLGKTPSGTGVLRATTDVVLLFARAFSGSLRRQFEQVDAAHVQTFEGGVYALARLNGVAQDLAERAVPALLEATFCGVDAVLNDGQDAGS